MVLRVRVFVQERPAVGVRSDENVYIGTAPVKRRFHRPASTPPFF